MIDRRHNGIVMLGQADHRMRDAIDLVWRAMNSGPDKHDPDEVESKCKHMLERCLESFKQDLVTLKEECR